MTPFSKMISEIALVAAQAEHYFGGSTVDVQYEVSFTPSNTPQVRYRLYTHASGHTNWITDLEQFLGVIAFFSATVLTGASHPSDDGPLPSLMPCTQCGGSTLMIPQESPSTESDPVDSRETVTDASLALSVLNILNDTSVWCSFGDLCDRLNCDPGQLSAVLWKLYTNRDLAAVFKSDVITQAETEWAMFARVSDDTSGFMFNAGETSDAT